MLGVKRPIETIHKRHRITGKSYVKVQPMSYNTPWDSSAGVEEEWQKCEACFRGDEDFYENGYKKEMAKLKKEKRKREKAAAEKALSRPLTKKSRTSGSGSFSSSSKIEKAKAVLEQKKIAELKKETKTKKKEIEKR